MPDEMMVALFVIDPGSRPTESPTVVASISKLRQWVRKSQALRECGSVVGGLILGADRVRGIPVVSEVADGRRHVFVVCPRCQEGDNVEAFQVEEAITVCIPTKIVA